MTYTAGTIDTTTNSSTLTLAIRRTLECIGYNLGQHKHLFWICFLCYPFSRLSLRKLHFNLSSINGWSSYFLYLRKPHNDKLSQGSSKSCNGRNWNLVRFWISGKHFNFQHYRNNHGFRYAKHFWRNCGLHGQAQCQWELQP